MSTHGDEREAVPVVGLAAIPEGLPADDRAFLADWISRMGDAATLRAIRGRIRALLKLQARHPDTPPLTALVDDPDVRALLLASRKGRRGVRARLLKRWLRDRE